MFVLTAIYFVAGTILGVWVMHLVARPSAPPEQTATLNPPSTLPSAAVSIAAPATPTAAITTATPTPQALNESVPSPPGYDFSHAVLPDSSLTPGDTFPGATAADVCTHGWSTEHRHVTEEMRNQVYAEYGRTLGPDCCEVDHLIPLELGGSNEMRNLWPNQMPLGREALRRTNWKMNFIVWSVRASSVSRMRNGASPPIGPHAGQSTHCRCRFDPLTEFSLAIVESRRRHHSAAVEMGGD
jgi:hypothetical protein